MMPNCKKSELCQQACFLNRVWIDQDDGGSYLSVFSSFSFYKVNVCSFSLNIFGLFKDTKDMSGINLMDSSEQESVSAAIL